LFDKPADYAAFEKVVRQAWERSAMRLLSYLVMPNHWHFVVWPRNDGELSTWAQWLTVTHVRRWHAHHHSAGTGPVYQGRFKSFPVQEDHHYFTVCRYVERNPLRANLVARAEHWRWSSLWRRVHYNADQIRFLRSVQEVFLHKRRLVEADLYEPPLTVYGRNAVERFFTPLEIRELLGLMKSLAA